MNWTIDLKSYLSKKRTLHKMYFLVICFAKHLNMLKFVLNVLVKLNKHKKHNDIAQIKSSSVTNVWLMWILSIIEGAWIR